MHGSEPTVNYAFLWTLWLSVVPYGLWSEQISRLRRSGCLIWRGGDPAPGGSSPVAAVRDRYGQSPRRAEWGRAR